MHCRVIVVAAILVALREPSTWASIAAALAAVGVHVSDPVWQGIVGVGVGLSVLAGIVLREGGARLNITVNQETKP